MSIAVHRLSAALARTRTAIAVESAASSPVEEVREMRAFLRHLVLAGTGAFAAIYAAIASGTIF